MSRTSLNSKYQYFTETRLRASPVTRFASVILRVESIGIWAVSMCEVRGLRAVRDTFLHLHVKGDHFYIISDHLYANLGHLNLLRPSSQILTILPDQLPF